MTDLLPCPFCGGRANLYINEVDFVEKWSVSCGDCNANMDVCEDDQAGAAEHWNTRAQPQSPAQSRPYLSRIFNELDEIDVDVYGLCRWVDVANAQTLMKLALNEALNDWLAGFNTGLSLPRPDRKSEL